MYISRFLCNLQTSLDAMFADSQNLAITVDHLLLTPFTGFLISCQHIPPHRHAPSRSERFFIERLDRMRFLPDSLWLS